MIDQQEKKVEYLELIYDLIFVYLIGRNNSLLHYIENGFVSAGTFLTYVLCSLAIIQIWNFSTFYINLYGRNGKRDHVFLFINMYLLYHMADGISSGWRASVDQFCIAWFLILVNIGVQHLIEMRNHRAESWILEQLKRKALIIIGEASLILVHMLVYHLFGISIAYVPILFGLAATLFSHDVNSLIPVDFSHLTERAMLYVVFTFGEMIISITGYFEDRISLNTLYFSGMAFLIVAGLFLSYEVFYDRIVDREITTNGTGYMMIHVFLIFALNNISVALDFMRKEEVAILPKTLFITGSFILYFVFLFLADIYAKKKCACNLKYHEFIGVLGLSFLILMIVFREQMALNIAISVVYVFAIFMVIYRKGKSAKSASAEAGSAAY